MAEFTFVQEMTLLDLFEMNGGYVMDFSNSSFATFVSRSIFLQVYGGKGYEDHKSKGQKLRQIWRDESNHRVAKLTNDLLDYCEVYNIRMYGEISKEKIKIIEDLRNVIQKLKSDTSIVNLPIIDEITLQTIQSEIRTALSKNQPSLILDRLHTFSVKYIRQLCDRYKIETVSVSGEYYPIQSLIGMLCKYFKSNGMFESDFSERAIKYGISIFESFNTIRNEKSFAHANNILDENEAEFVVSVISALLSYINKIDEKFQKSLSIENDTAFPELSFDL